MAKSKDDTHRTYQEEADARSRFFDALSCYFDLKFEVKARGLEGDEFSIDAVGRCYDTGRIVGFEFKRSHLFKSEFAAALRQAIYYRLARITDTRFSDFDIPQLPALFVFPDWLGLHDNGKLMYAGEADGMRFLAGQFRVGTVRETANERFSFIMHESGVWHSNSGWTKNSEGVLFGKRPIGAARKHDGRSSD